MDRVLLSGLSSYLRRTPGRIRRYPRSQLLRLTLALAVVLCVACLVWIQPYLLLGLVPVLTVWYWYRAVSISRTSAPPESHLPFQLGYFADGDFLQRQRDKHGSVFTVRPVVSPVTCIVDLDTAVRFLSAHEQHIEPRKPVFYDLIEKGFIRSMAPEDHRRYKPVLARAVSQSTINDREEALRAIVSDHLSQMAARSVNGDSAGIDPRPALRSMIFECWMLLFYGLRLNASLCDEIRHMNHVLNEHRSGAISRKEALVALNSVSAAIRAATVSALTKDDTAPAETPSFLANIFAEDPSLITDQTVLGNTIYMFINSANDVLGLFVWIFKMLADHPAWVTRTGDDMRLGSGVSQPCVADTATRIILETLRLRQSEYMWRKTLADIEFDGFSIARGTLIRLCIRECHRDGRVFERPLDFDPDRFVDRRYDRTEYSPFGAHRHACIGERLTFTVSRLLVEEIARRYDLCKTADGPTQFGGFGGHWEPSAKFRVMLQPRCTTSSTDL